MAKLYLPNGTITDVVPKNKQKGFQLEELYDLLKCRVIECIEFAPKLLFICDEEFRLKPGWTAHRNYQANKVITDISGDDWDLAGRVIICTNKEFK